MALTQIKLFDNKKQVTPSLVTPKTKDNPRNIILEKSPIKELTSNKATLETALNSIFLGSKEENELQLARRIMKETINNLSDEELKTFITEFECLLGSWLDKFEKQIFNDKTLKQLLKEA